MMPHQQRINCMGNSENTIPKIIWIMWSQGISNAPFPVQKCIDSWRTENPDWEIIFLDNSNLSDYVALDLPAEKLSKMDLTKQSDLIRLQLLIKYGGVWADATTFCTKPLESWIHEYTDSGFFAFSNAGRGKIMASWFMVSSKGSPIPLKLRDAFVKFFIENDFKNDGRFRRVILRFFSRVLNKRERTVQFWLSPFATKVLKVYPYFIFHYLFAKLVSTDIECKEIWNNTKKMSAKPLFRLLNAQYLSNCPQDLKAEIDDECVPMYKLSWKTDYSNYGPSSALYYLLEK